MGKKKARLSLFSTLIEQINEPSNEYHLIDQEYFAAFDSLDDIEHFQQQLTEKQSAVPIEDETDVQVEEDMDMKSFAQQYLVDLPENLQLAQTSSQELFSAQQPINWSPKLKSNAGTTQSPDAKKRKSTTPVRRNTEMNDKRRRRNIRDLPQSSEFIFTFDKESRKPSNPTRNIVDSSQDETSSTDNVNSPSEHSLTHELPKSLLIKNEPIDSDQPLVEAKEEPVEINAHPADLMGFGSSKYSGDLDNYVQNVHLLHQPSNNSPTTSRPKRIRKRKKFFSEESELIARPKKLKTIFRKKRPSVPLSQTSSAVRFTDAEIEQQFGERLPVVKSEQDDDPQPTATSRVIIEFQPVPQTPLEKARAKLTNALGRGHDPDSYLLKIRSREHRIIEVQLSIYSTADWYSHRIKILSKIEEALRGLRVSWTKIDTRVDDFDIQISTSSQTSTSPPPSSVATNSSSWFLKLLSESGPLIVHIHDRRYPQQRFLLKCSCPECSPVTSELCLDSSLPVLVNVSPATTPTRRLTPPTILNKSQPTNISSLHNIATTFFNDLIYQWGRTTVISVTQCVLDLALIVSVHASLPSLSVSPNFSKEEYKKKYQQIIDPLKCTLNETEPIPVSKTPMIARVVSVNSVANRQSVILSKPPNILTFYNAIKFNRANIRSAKSMRSLITASFPSFITSPTQTRTSILPKPTSSIPSSDSQAEQMIKSCNEQIRRSPQTNRHDKFTRVHQEIKQQAQCTPIIELKPILGGPVLTTQNNGMRKTTTIISTHPQSNDTITELFPPPSNSARVIRLSIAKPAQPHFTSPPTIRLVSSPKTDAEHSSTHSILSVNKGETVPLVPKQINIIKPFSSSSPSITPAIKLSNPVLITNKPQPSSTQ